MKFAIVLSIVIAISIAPKDVNAAAQYCYDPTNTQTLETRRTAGETNGPASSTVSGGIVTCSATNAYCGIVLASGMGVCVTSSSPTSAILVTGPDSGANTYAGTTNVKSCFATTTSLVLCPASSTLGVVGCYTNKNGVGSCLTASLASAETTVSYLFSNPGAYCFTTNCNQPNMYVNGEARMQMSLISFYLTSLIAFVLTK